MYKRQVPSFVGATALIAATGRGGLVPFVPRPQGFLGAFVVLTLLCYPYVYLLVLARLRYLPRSHEEAARLLQQTLDEEGATDQKLTKLAESRVNPKAMRG